MTIVVDASAIVDLLLNRSAAPAVEQTLLEHAAGIHAPYLLEPEVLSALRRSAAGGHLQPKRAGEAVADLVLLPVQYHAQPGLAPRMWQLRENLTPYDAAYLALAEHLTDDGVPVLTTDRAFARAVDRHGGVPALLAE